MIFIKINNKWVTPTDWLYHIENKNVIREPATKETCEFEDLAVLEKLQVDDKWLVNDGEGDPPNMDFIRRLWADYWEAAQRKGIPLLERPFIEKWGKKIVSLFRQDSAYSERMGGLIIWFIYNAARWKGKGKKQRLQVLRDAHDWWDVEDYRERTKVWIEWYWKITLKGYEKREFWEWSINFIIDWIVQHKDEFGNQPMYDPKVWFPRGRGQANTIIHGGIA